MAATKHGDMLLPITTTIDYIDSTSFPHITSRTIGELDGTKFFCLSDAGAYPCGQRSALSNRGHRIQLKAEPEKPEPGPGPQKYTPKAVLPRAPAYPLSGPKVRDDWMVDTKCSPSPNFYRPHKPESTMPFYSIGYRSRLGAKPTTPFAIGTFIAKLDDGISVNQAKRYLKRHPEFADFVDDLLNTVLEERSEDPIQFISDHFAALKAEQESKRKSSRFHDFHSFRLSDFDLE
jgi:hypothetical protein